MEVDIVDDQDKTVLKDESDQYNCLLKQGIVRQQRQVASSPTDWRRVSRRSWQGSLAVWWKTCITFFGIRGARNKGYEEEEIKKDWWSEVEERSIPKAVAAVTP